MAIAPTPPLINGVSYTHAEIVLNIMGVPVIGMTAITYSKPQNITLNYGTGHKPVSRGFGTLEPQGTITLSMEEVERLTAAAPFREIQNIPDFPIGVNFVTEDAKFTRHVLVRCRFKGRATSSEVNNSQILETLELSIADINY